VEGAEPSSEGGSSKTLQKQLKNVENREFFQNTATGTQITTKNMDNYRANQIFLPTSFTTTSRFIQK
jgi:hypothetical protein